MTESVLFVGGCADGKRIAVKGLQYFDIPKLTEGGFRIERYHRETLTNGKQDFHVYLSTTEPPDNLIPLLIEGYRKEKK